MPSLEGNRGLPTTGIKLFVLAGNFVNLGKLKFAINIKSRRTDFHTKYPIRFREYNFGLIC